MSEKATHHLDPHRPARLVIDSLAPFVTTVRCRLGPVVLALVATCSSDSSQHRIAHVFRRMCPPGYDRNLEPLVQNASAVIRLIREKTRTVRSSRTGELCGYPAPVGHDDDASSCGAESLVSSQSTPIRADHACVEGSVDALCVVLRAERRRRSRAARARDVSTASASPAMAVALVDPLAAADRPIRCRRPES